MNDSPSTPQVGAQVAGEPKSFALPADVKRMIEIERARFIPFRKRDVIEMCATDASLPESDRDAFRELCRLLEAVFHFEFHEELERLKDAYAPFDPNSDTRAVANHSPEQLAAKRRELVDGLTRILEAANFEPITREDLDAAMAEESMFKIRLHVDFDQFEDVLFFCRGEAARTETVRSWLGLREREIEFVNYSRVAMYVRFKAKEHFALDDLPFEPGSTIIKLFQDVPKADLEMLFPNTEVRMKTLDKLLIGVPALVGGIVVVATKLLGTLVLIGSLIAFWIGISDKQERIDQAELIALAIGLGTLGGFIFKQVNTFKNRKIRFMKVLADNLYFKNLDNNAGVFHHLLDAAEEEECKEAILGYSFLLRHPEGLTEQQLDGRIESWFEERCDCSMDFEVEDALRKLERLELVERDGDTLRAKPLADAVARLHHVWDVAPERV